jgi:hypothetical protein
VKLTIVVELGNAAMQTGQDVSEAVRIVANQLEQRYGREPCRQDEGRIRDLNGNTVGKWELD